MIIPARYYQRIRPFLCLSIVTGGMLAGCGQSGPARFAVSGTVTADGIPVSFGTIAFVPETEGAGPMTGGEIKDGTYRIKAPQGPVAGPHKVEIRAWRENGKPKMASIGGTTVGPSAISPTEERLEMFVPGKYNTHTTLTFDVQPEQNEKNFSLECRAK
jgi:hypothetical protein